MTFNIDYIDAKMKLQTGNFNCMWTVTEFFHIHRPVALRNSASG